MIFAAETMTVEQMALTICHAAVPGVVPTEERRKQLDLLMMVENNTSAYGTGFTVTIEAAEGVTTGVSAADRVTTVRGHRRRRETFRSQPSSLRLLQQLGAYRTRGGHTGSHHQPRDPGWL
ncbi:3,4-dihydroxy-2-butanone-4-phosphate synthase [Klebsiella pneumoniae]|nr:3,4-dihydroxy-2-butanone-4-phosphate synthase [Klebsiella pneumoniae]